MIELETPWSQMKSPSGKSLSTLRVHYEPNPWYWVRSSEGFFGVAIQLPANEAENTATLEGTAKISIARVNDTNGDHYLGVMINASELATVFHRLCLDLISACSYSESANIIISIVKRRVLAWQRLFEKGGGKLSPEKCLGLIAELKFLKEHWVHDISPHCVSGWLGPNNAPQDFKDEPHELSVEIKLHSFTSNIVKISSKEQLDSEGRLFLVAYPGCITSSEDGKSLNEYIYETRSSIPSNQVPVFDEKLLSAGYVKDDSYDDIKFQLGNPKAYRVEGQFPRLTINSISSAISQVQYSLDLSLVADWALPIEDIIRKEKKNG